MFEAILKRKTRKLNKIIGMDLEGNFVSGYPIKYKNGYMEIEILIDEKENIPDKFKIKYELETIKRDDENE